MPRLKLYICRNRQINDFFITERKDWVENAEKSGYKCRGLYKYASAVLS